MPCRPVEAMEEELKVNSRMRAGHKARVTKLCRELEKSISEGTSSEAWVRDTVQEIQRQREFVEALDKQILPKCADMETEIENSSEFSIETGRVLRIAAQRISDEATRPTATVKTTVKLPTINLLKFGGNPLDWQSFWDLFRTSIHDRNDIADPAKFHYLIGQLEGDAAMLLGEFDHSSENYHEAIDLLKQTYGKKKLIIQTRLNAIFDMDAPNPTCADLSKFRSLYEAHIRGLKSLGANIMEAGYVFAALLLRKIPGRLLDNMNRARQSEEVWSLEDLRAGIEAEIDHLRLAEETADYKRLPGDNADFPRGEFISTVSYSSNNGSRNSSSTRCAFCNDSHSPFHCMKYKSAECKRDRVKELKLCFNCLRSNHGVRDCRVQNSCNTCGRRHHTTICEVERPQRSSNNVVTDENLQESTQSDTISGVTLQGMNARLNRSNDTSILPTATISLVGNSGAIDCSCLFDTGAQKTYILESVAKSLGSAIVGYKKLTIEGFNTTLREKVYPVVEVTTQSKEGSIRFNAIAIDALPSKISMPGRSNLVQSLELPGTFFARGIQNDCIQNLGLLVGVDNYFKFVKAQNLTDTVYLIPSVFGNLIA